MSLSIHIKKCRKKIQHKLDKRGIKDSKSLLDTPGKECFTQDVRVTYIRLIGGAWMEQLSASTVYKSHYSPVWLLVFKLHKIRIILIPETLMLEINNKL